jgi:MFS family permease
MTTVADATEPSTHWTEELPRRVSELLRDRTFGPYFIGQIVATMGVWIHNVAAAIIVWQLTRSTTLVAAITIGQFAPQILLTPWSGARADRTDRRRQLVAGTLTTAAGTGFLAAWSAGPGLVGTTGAHAVVFAATVVGIGFAIGGPAAQALLPSLVRRSELPTAIAISSVPMTVARALGPAVGALLVTTSGPTVTFAVVTVLQVTYGLMMFRRHRTPSNGTRRDTRILAAVSYLGRDRPMGYLLVGVTIVGLGVDPVITLAPAFADALGGAGDLVGLITSAFGVGAILGFIVQPALRRRIGLERSGTVGLIVLAVGLTPLGLASVPSVAVATMLVAGTGMTLSLTAFTTAIQQRVPDALRGRVMALWSIAFLGSRPLAAALSGVLSDVAGEDVALFAAVLIILAGAVISRPSLTREIAPGPADISQERFAGPRPA